MQFFLNDVKSVARALCAGFGVKSATTGVIYTFSPSSFRRAKQTARLIMSDCSGEALVLVRAPHF